MQNGLDAIRIVFVQAQAGKHIWLEDKRHLHGNIPLGTKPGPENIGKSKTQAEAWRLGPSLQAQQKDHPAIHPSPLGSIASHAVQPLVSSYPNS